MLICASCGRDNPPGAGFCNSCGAALASLASSREVRTAIAAVGPRDGKQLLFGRAPGPEGSSDIYLATRP